ncbi:MAG: hypothetical protein GXP24_01535 [Planctomycetes bacterium]|nr:hypothetical protein [Planctomycetota bacterium]
MLDILFLMAAVVGGTVMVCQFLMTMLGLGDDGAGDGDFGGDVGVDVSDFDGGGDVDMDIDGDHHTPIHHAADADVDHPGSSWLFQVLSFRTVVAALTFFGLGGAWSSSSGHEPALSLVIALAAGGGAMFGMYHLMKAIYGFQSSGNVDIRNAVGQPAKIYIPVPSVGEGKGKVQVSLQGRTMEYEAVTDEDEKLRTGENVIVEAVVGSDIVKVMRT